MTMNFDGITPPVGYPRKSIPVPEYKLAYLETEMPVFALKTSYLTWVDLLLGLTAIGLSFYWYWGFVLDNWYK